ncbi:MAG: AsmA family protein, partial [Candidatus Binatia bacterium]
MKKKARKALMAVLIAFVLLISLLIVSLNTLIDKNREGIREEIQKVLGRSISFGKVRLDLWGGLGISAKNLSVADDPRFAATPLIQTKEFKMQVRWLPLLLGKIEIK